MTRQQSFIKQFTGADVYKSDLIAYLTHFCTDLTHFHYVLTHTNLMWLRSMLSDLGLGLASRDC